MHDAFSIEPLTSEGWQTSCRLEWMASELRLQESQEATMVNQQFARGMIFLAGAGAAAVWAGQQLRRRGRWFDYAGKSVIVTGGSRGLGLVLARELVALGARVTICARTEKDVQVAADELRRQGGQVEGIVCDVRNREEVQSLVDRTIAEYGRIDVLLNVAGVMKVGPLDEMTEEDFREAMEINCFGPLHTVLAALPVMRRQGWGRIVNVASIGGKRAVPHMLPYDTSKFALVGLSTGLRTELMQDGILVTTVCPSLMRTGSPRNAEFKGQHRKEYAWFSIGGSLPLISMNAERAAQQILRACQHGDGDVYITNMLSPAVWAAELAPALTNELLALINFWLPKPGGIGQRSAYGYESESIVAPSLLTALGDQAAERNNEMNPRAFPS
jgi:NAD(P)-dependent dehydrogenase (short-subunit alcohol dehydrogenase family)